MDHTVARYHDFCAGHRVVGHENKCRHLHGHNYRVHFECEAEYISHDTETELDPVGRVIDFGDIKERLCDWLENNWDHKFLAWEKDTALKPIFEIAADLAIEGGEEGRFCESIVWLPFNPTAENMAQYLVDVIGPQQLEGTGVVLRSIRIEETRKCSATYTKKG